MPEPMAAPPVHHADVREHEVAAGDIAFRRRRLGSAAGAARIGASHYLVAPGARQMPVHQHGDEEEVVYVIGGEGIGYELDGDDPEGPAITYPVGPGDVIVHRPRRRPHTLLAGRAGLELIVFGSGSETSITFLPRAGVMWCGPRWTPVDAPHPFDAEAAAGRLVAPAPDPDAVRPAHVIHRDDVAPVRRSGRAERRLGAAAGSRRAGLNQIQLEPGASGAPAHCHTLEEELFVVLGGAGTLRLGDAEHPLVAGDVIARPPGTGVAHQLIAGAGPDGLTFLAFGTREPGDIVHLPDAGTIRIRGLGVSLPVG
jgi:uncharacterized cupin superfamily protein